MNTSSNHNDHNSSLREGVVRPQDLLEKSASATTAAGAGPTGGGVAGSGAGGKIETSTALSAEGRALAMEIARTRPSPSASGATPVTTKAEGGAALSSSSLPPTFATPTSAAAAAANRKAAAQHQPSSEGRYKDTNRFNLPLVADPPEEADEDVLANSATPFVPTTNNATTTNTNAPSNPTANLLQVPDGSSSTGNNGGGGSSDDLTAGLKKTGSGRRSRKGSASNNNFVGIIDKQRTNSQAFMNSAAVSASNFSFAKSRSLSHAGMGNSATPPPQNAVVPTHDVELQIETTSSVISRIIFYGWYAILLLAIILQVIITVQWDCKNVCGGDCGLLQLDKWHSQECYSSYTYSVTKEEIINGTEENVTLTAYDLTWAGSVGYVAEQKLTRFVHLVLVMPRPNVTHNDKVEMELQFALNVSNVVDERISSGEVVERATLTCQKGEPRCEAIFLNTNIAQAATNTSSVSIVITEAPKELVDVSGGAGVAYVFQKRSYTIGTLVVRYTLIGLSLLHLVRFLYHKPINGLYEQTWVVVLHFALFLFLDPLFAGGVYTNPTPSLFSFVEFRMPLYFIAVFISFMFSVITASHAWVSDADVHNIAALYDPPARTKLIAVAFIALVVGLDLVDGYLHDWDWESEHCPDFKCSVPGFMMYIAIGLGVIVCTCWLWWLRGNLGQKPYFACRAQQLAFRIFVLVFVSAVMYLIVQTILVFAIYNKISPLVTFQILVQLGPVLVLAAFVNIMTFVYTSNIRTGKSDGREKGVPIRPTDPKWKETYWDLKWFRWLALHGGSMYMFVSEVEEQFFDYIQDREIRRRQEMVRQGFALDDAGSNHGLFGVSNLIDRFRSNHGTGSVTNSPQQKPRGGSFYDGEMEFTIPEWKLDRDLTPFERRVREYEMRLALERQAEAEREEAEHLTMYEGFDLGRMDDDDDNDEDAHRPATPPTPRNGERDLLYPEGKDKLPKSGARGGAKKRGGKKRGGTPTYDSTDDGSSTSPSTTPSQRANLKGPTPPLTSQKSPSLAASRSPSAGPSRGGKRGGGSHKGSDKKKNGGSSNQSGSPRSPGSSVNPLKTVANFGRGVVSAMTDAPNALGEGMQRLEDGLINMGYAMRGGHPIMRKPFFNLETCVDLFNLSWEVYGRPTPAADIYLITDAHRVARRNTVIEVAKPLWQRILCCFNFDSTKDDENADDNVFAGEALVGSGGGAGGAGSPNIGSPNQHTAIDVDDNGQVHNSTTSPIVPDANGVLPIAPIADVTRQHISGGPPRHFEGDSRPVDNDSTLAPPICTEQYGYELVAVHEALDVQMIICLMDTNVPVHHGKAPRIVVAFRGSANRSNFEQDVRFTRVRWTEMPSKNAISDKWVGPTVHQGFLNVWSALRHFCLTEVQELVRHVQTKLGPNSPPPAVYLTGHSLGGAVATFCAYAMKKTLRIEPIVYTFGAPIVGNKAFKDEYNKEIPKTFRVVNESDMVVGLTQFGGHHIGIEAAVDRMGNFVCEPMFIERWLRPTQGKGLAAANHMLGAYGASLNAIIEQGRFGRCPIKCQKSYFEPHERSIVMAIASRRKEHERRLLEKETGLYDQAIHNSVSRMGFGQSTTNLLSASNSQINSGRVSGTYYGNASGVYGVAPQGGGYGQNTQKGSGSVRTSGYGY